MRPSISQVPVEVSGGGSFCVSETIPYTYENTISVENLLGAWREFLKGKRKKKDVQEFERNLMSNIFSLHNDLLYKTYVHGGYKAFKINDPKPRDIHKPSVRDRLLHHAIYRQLYPLFDSTFIPDSYSCRQRKGTHKAIARFRYYVQKESKNNTRTLWILKCDIKKFFASINHQILIQVVQKHIKDTSVMWLIGKVTESFHSTSPGKGIPLGNLTSQLLVNVYMNEFDQYAKNTLKTRSYIRYADDFVFMSTDKNSLLILLAKAKKFLNEALHLELHPRKVSIQTLASGVDFLGWVHFPHHLVLRTATKRRMFRNIEVSSNESCPKSYLGMLKHGNAYKLSLEIEDILHT